MIRKVRLMDLTAHPKNAEIYGDESITDLIENIKKYGILSPVVITDKNVIISGHRRFRACKALGHKKIDAITKHYDSDEDELEDLVNLNLSRTRTEEQKAREAMTLVEVEKIKAKIRMESGIKIDPVANSPQGSGETVVILDSGKSRDLVAEKVGFKSGREVERAISTVKKIDELKNRGDEESLEKAELLKGVLNNRNPSAAESLSSFIDDVDIKEDDREKIKAGFKSPNSYIEDAKEKSMPDYIICSKCGRRLHKELFSKGRRQCSDCINAENGKRVKQKSYMTSITGEEFTIDEDKLKGVDFDAIENSLKCEEVGKKIIINPKSECMEFQARAKSFVLQNSKYISVEEIIAKMDDETKKQFLISIKSIENLLSNIRNKL